MHRLAVLAACLALSGCVSFGSCGHSGGAAARYTWTIGAYSACGAYGVGVQRCAQLREDARDCGALVVENPSPDTRRLLTQITKRVRAECQQTEESPK